MSNSPLICVTVLTDHITLWSCWLNRGWVILFNSAVFHLMVLSSTLVLLAEKDVRASMSLPPVSSHGSFSHSDTVALSACKSSNIRSSCVCSHGFAFPCGLIGLTECEPFYNWFSCVSYSHFFHSYLGCLTGCKWLHVSSTCDSFTLPLSILVLWTQ